MNYIIISDFLRLHVLVLNDELIKITFALKNMSLFPSGYDLKI